MREMYAKILMNGKRMRSSSTNKTAVMLLEINLNSGICELAKLMQ